MAKTRDFMLKLLVMGSYSIFNVNKAYHWEYKYHIPYFFLFIFDNNDFHKETDEEEEWYSFLGYKSSAGKCLKRLDEYGYSRSFFHEIVEDVMMPDYKIAIESALEEKAISLVSDLKDVNKIAQHKKALLKKYNSVTGVGKFRIRKNDDTLTTLIEYLKYLIKNKPENELLELCSKSKFGKSNTKGIAKKDELEHLKFKIKNIFTKARPSYGKELKGINLENLVYLISEFPDVFGKEIHFGSLVFEGDFGIDFGEIFDLIQVHIILSAVHYNTAVSINIAELMDGDLAEAEKEAKEMKRSISNQVFRKIKIYNKVYEILAEKGSKKNLSFGKKILKENFAEIYKINRPQDRGRKFEDFLDDLISMSENISVISKRLNLKDQEIDLIVQNNIPKPYIQNFQSPHIMIEAKFTKSKIGSSDVRDFRSKMQDQSHLCKIGLFFSVSGFTSEVNEALKRSSTETIICINKDDIIEYLDSTYNSETWIEELIKKKSFR